MPPTRRIPTPVHVCIWPHVADNAGAIKSTPSAPLHLTSLLFKKATKNIDIQNQRDSIPCPSPSSCSAHICSVQTYWLSIFALQSIFDHSHVLALLLVAGYMNILSSSLPPPPSQPTLYLSIKDELRNWWMCRKRSTKKLMDWVREVFGDKYVFENEWTRSHEVEDKTRDV
jgi:hypothetical protein